MKSTHIETVAIHGSMRAQKAENSPIVPGIELSTIYEHAKDGHREGDLKYSRLENPNRLELEAVLNDLEKGAEAAAFSSGIAAINAVFQTLSHGDHVLIPNDVYFGTRKLMWEFSERWGLEIDFVDMTNLEVVEAAAKKNTRMIWIETPTNPLLKIADLSAISQFAKKHNLIAVCDNTFCSPFVQNPLDFGFDIVVHSATKYLNGHSDLIGGVVVCSNEKEDLANEILYLQNAVGSIMNPFDSFLLLRSLKTLPVRMERHCSNAKEIANFLESHKAIEKVIYPGLVSHPQHEIAKKQMKGFGGMISVVLKGGLDSATKFLEKTKIFSLAESLGGVESLIEHPAIMTHASIPREVREEIGISDGLVRLSVGIESLEDLFDDIENALS